MLAVLLEAPDSPEMWSRYAFHTSDQINLLQQAILEKYNAILPQYVLFPINLDQPQQWLQNNSAAHTQINQILGLQSHDLLTVDITDPDDLADWVNISYQELYDASVALGV